MKDARGRWVAMITGALVLVVAGLLALEWREVAVRYHIWRLDRAATREEARPWIEALARDSAGPGMSESIVRKLGPAHQNFTFWFFLFRPSEGVSVPDVGESPGGQEFLPLVREVCRRLETDEALLSSWAQFIRWRKLPLVERCLTEFRKPSGAVHFLVTVLSFRSETRDVFASFDHQDEVSQKLSFLEYLGTVWILGMEDRPACPEFSDDFQKMWEASALLNEKLNRWIRNRRGSFRFDPGKGRFVPREAPDASGSSVPDPAVPFPGWSGPVPALDEQPISETFLIPGSSPPVQ